MILAYVTFIVYNCGITIFVQKYIENGPSFAYTALSIVLILLI